jgi:Uncharacterised conserved protein
MDLLQSNCYSSNSSDSDIDIEEDDEEEEKLEEQDDENETEAVSIVAAAATAKICTKKNASPPPAGGVRGATTTTTTAATATTALPRRGKRGNVTVVSSSTDQNGGSAGISMGTKRIRQQGHVVGNWAGLCFLPVRIDDDNDEDDIALSFFQIGHRRRFAEQLGRTLEELGYSGVCCVHHDNDDDEPLHVSLSRPFYLQQANLQPFVRALSAELQRTTQGGDTIMDDAGRIPHRRRREGEGPRGPFQITIDARQVVILTNDDATRSFLAWNVHDTGGGRGAAQSPQLARLIACCDRILQCYHQPVFYDTPQYHVSWASFVPAIPPDLIPRCCTTMMSTMTMMKQMIGTADNDDDDYDDDNGHCIDVTITHLCVKFGTVQLFEIPL